ncbi:MAG: creatininase family protein [Methanococcaceae archaeon]
MKTTYFFLALISVLIFNNTQTVAAATDSTTSVPIRYEEITSPDFVRAVAQSASTCIIPFGILEKHGPHLPLGTDLLDARELALRAASKEYTIIYPQYYFGQIFEARHQPGAIAYSNKIIWDLLQETCDELSRNGIKKIIIVNGHGGNTYFLNYFCQAQLEKRKDYAVILFSPKADAEAEKQIASMRKTNFDAHAGETETSTVLAHRPDLVKLEMAKSQNGEDQNRLNDLQEGFTGIWWYAKFPNHYAGDGDQANAQLGEVIINSKVNQLIKLVREVKKDNNVIELQNKFFDQADNPLKTK